jgi:hypothetical protein
MKIVLRVFFLLCLLGGPWAVAANLSPVAAASSCRTGKEARNCAYGSRDDTACLPGQE